MEITTILLLIAIALALALVVKTKNWDVSKARKLVSDAKEKAQSVFDEFGFPPKNDISEEPTRFNKEPVFEEGGTVCLPELTISQLANLQTKNIVKQYKLANIINTKTQRGYAAVISGPHDKREGISEAGKCNFIRLALTADSKTVSREHVSILRDDEGYYAVVKPDATNPVYKFSDAKGGGAPELVTGELPLTEKSTLLLIGKQYLLIELSEIAMRKIANKSLEGKTKYYVPKKSRISADIASAQ